MWNIADCAQANRFPFWAGGLDVSIPGTYATNGSLSLERQEIFGWVGVWNLNPGFLVAQTADLCDLGRGNIQDKSTCIFISVFYNLRVFGVLQDVPRAVNPVTESPPCWLHTCGWAFLKPNLHYNVVVSSSINYTNMTCATGKLYHVYTHMKPFQSKLHQKSASLSVFVVFCSLSQCMMYLYASPVLYF
jgi:hypothetical protein